MSAQDKATLENIAQFLYREARFLDDEQWDDWLECYAPKLLSGCQLGTTTID